MKMCSRNIDLQIFFGNCLFNARKHHLPVEKSLPVKIKVWKEKKTWFPPFSFAHPLGICFLPTYWHSMKFHFVEFVVIALCRIFKKICWIPIFTFFVCSLFGDLFPANLLAVYERKFYFVEYRELHFFEL